MPTPANAFEKTAHGALPPDSTDTIIVGCAQIIQSHSITQLIKKQVAFNQAQKTVDGYRIEIFSDSGSEAKAEAGKIRTDFITQYKDVKAYLSFNQPNYAIRVGDFKDRIDAIRFMQKIKGDYHDAILVKDKVMK